MISLKKHRASIIMLAIFLLVPLIDTAVPRELRLGDALIPILIFSILGLGLNVVTGFTGLLNLGVAGFMAIGAYSYGILTCNIYPFQFNFWMGVISALLIGAGSGLLLGLPTIRLSGDYLAIVTLGFGEIIQDLLRNLESITKGTQGINPLPAPQIFGYTFSAENYQAWYYLILLFVGVVILLLHNLENSRIGRSWIALREDELACSCSGISPIKIKLFAFVTAAALCALSGALWASFLGSTGEPGNYDFQISVLALCMVIVGGIGSTRGVLLGAIIMIGFNSIILVRISDFLAKQGIYSSGQVLLSPNNWKYLIFGLALILTMRFKPDGLLPPKNANRN